MVFDSLGYPFRVAPRAQAYALAPEVDPIPGFADEPDPGPRWRGLHWRDAEPHGPARRWSFAGASDATGALVGGGLAYRAGTGARYWQAGFVGERDRVHGGAAAGSWAGVDGDLSPEAREVRLTGRHEVEGRYGRLAVAAGLRLNAGHRAGEEDRHAGVQWGLRF